MKKLNEFDEMSMRKFLEFVVDFGIGATEIMSPNSYINPRTGFIEKSDYKTTTAGWFDSIDSIVASCRAFSGVSAYIIPNPIKPELIARSDNRIIKIGSGMGANDHDVIKLRFVLIDIDSVRDNHISATDEEMMHALNKRDMILNDHKELKDSSIWGCSGNGGWILSRIIDNENTASNVSKIKSLLANLDKVYSDKHAVVDTKTYNPVRAMCLPGTMKCKGSDLTESRNGRPARPHRIVTLY